jgi:L-iditol 2-dehydrogenase
MMAIQSCFEASCHYCQSGHPQLCPQRYVQGLHRDGGMANYVTIRSKYLLPLPDGQDLLAASLIEPLSVAVHCVEDCSSIAKGDRVVVCGPGIIGMFCGLVAKLNGANVVLAGTLEDEVHRLSAARKI